MAPVVPVEFTRFFTETLSLTWASRAQYVLARVAFDGVEPRDLETSEDRDLARKLFGDVDEIPAIARLVLAAIVGARAGKTYLFSLRVLHLSLIHPLETLAPGEIGFGIIVAPDTDTADQAFRYCVGAIEAVPALSRMIVANKHRWLALHRPDGRKVAIVCRAAKRGGMSGRGRSMFAALLDECCFFTGENYVVNDKEIYRGIAPRILPGGQFILASTPWEEAGILYTLWKENHSGQGGTCETALAIHAATTFLRHDEHTAGFVQRERALDPDNARREFDAEPMAAVFSSFFDLEVLRAAIVDDMPDMLMPRQFTIAAAGLDTAFRRDPAAEVIAHKNGRHIDIAEVFELVPSKDRKLKPSEVIGEMMSRARFHGCTCAVADQHYIETVREHANGVTLREAPGGEPGKTEVYTAFRTALNEGRIRISAQHEGLIRQLREVRSKPMSGGKLQIVSPRRAGSHGDIASAAVLAVWALTQGEIGVMDVHPVAGGVATHGLPRKGEKRGPGRRKASSY